MSLESWFLLCILGVVLTIAKKRVNEIGKIVKKNDKN